MNRVKKIDTQQMTFIKKTFLRLFNRFKASFAIPYNREVVDISFVNNTVVLKHSPIRKGRAAKREVG